LNLKNHRYFNSGVLLLDIQKWNEQRILEQVIAALMSNPQKFRYPDQDALNLILTGKVYYLADKWNHLNVVTADQQESILLHFAAHPKPWNIAWPISKICNDFTRDIYYRYEQLTPWQESPLLLPKNYKEMKIYAECLLSQGEYIQGLNWYLRYIKTKLTG
jgi:lipopolysaccharide biosynthesis glycosyltransferase